MTNYSINIEQGGKSEQHTVDLPDFEAVQEQIIKVFGEMIRERARSPAGCTWSIEARDEAGNRVYKMTFAEEFHLDEDAPHVAHRQEAQTDNGQGQVGG